jgi:hypothetical protein
MLELKTKFVTITISMAILILPCLSCQATPSPTHPGEPVVFMSIVTIMGEENDYFSIYEDGYIIFEKDFSSRLPPASAHWTRTWYTGQILSGDLSSLENFIQTSDFSTQPDMIKYSTVHPDAGFESGTNVTIIANFDGLQKTVAVAGFLDLNDMPAPLNKIYSWLWGLAQITEPVITQTFPVSVAPHS